MKLSMALGLAGADIHARAGRNVMLALAIGLGCAVLTLISTAALAIRDVALRDVIDAFPATQLEVQQKQLRVLYFKFGSLAASLNEKSIKAIQAIDGVSKVYPEARCPFPAIVQATVLGRPFYTETCIFGVEREFVEDSLERPAAFAYPSPDRVVPAVISKALLQMFNTGFAPTRDIPKLDESLLIGLELDLYLGASATQAKPRKLLKRRLRIVGVSPRVSLVGISVPMGYVREWNEWWSGGKRQATQYNRLIVRTDSARHTDAVADKIEQMGLAVTSGKQMSAGLTAIAKLLTWLVAGLGAAVLVLTGVGVLNAAALDTAERVGWMGLLRACGATRLEVVGLAVFESAIVGAAGGGVGGALAWAASSWLGASALGTLPTVVAHAGGLLAGWWQTGLAVGLGVTALSGLAALWPAVRAVRMSPAQALAEG